MTAETATISLIRTKLHRPPVAPDILPRARLLEQLNEGRQRPLSLICAPAGYGKSTLASRWLGACDCPSAWLSLDESENDLRLFLNYLLSAIKTMFPDAVPNTQALVNASTLPPLPVLTGSLVNELDLIKQDFILALDDYQYIHERAVHDLFTELLRHPPQNMHLALLTRRDPPLPISTLRARGRVAEVRAQDLRFTPAETAAYLEKLLGEWIDESTAAAWTEKTQGWVSGLRLAAISIRHRGDVKSMLPEQQGDAQYVMEYLFTEVLADQPPRVRDYLLSTSILNRFCAPLCDALRGPDVELGPDEIDSWKFIALLKQENMFVISLDAESHWFRYHHLFQDLLQSQLKRRYSSEEIATLHSRASKWFAENGLIDEAIQHALAAGKVISAAQLVEQNRQAVLNADRWYVLEKWLARLPDSLIQQRPGLLLAKTWILYHHYNITRIPPVIDAAETLLSDSQDDQSLRGEIDFFRGYVYYFQNEGARSLKHLHDALKRIPESYHEIRGQSEILHGLASQMQGQKERAVKTLNDLLHQHRFPETIRITRLQATLVYIHIISGGLDEALSANKQLYEFAAKNAYSYAKVWSVYLQGLIHFYRGDLEEAIGHFHRALDQKYLLHTRAVVDSTAGLAFAYQTVGKPENAIAAVNSLGEFCDSIRDPTCSLIADSCHTRLSIMQEEQEPVAAFLRGYSPPVENMVWWLEIPCVTRCRALIAEGSDVNLREADERLREYAEMNEARHNTCQLVTILNLQAIACEKQGKRDEAHSILERALGLAQPGGFIFPFLELGPPMVDLLKRLIKKNVAVEYIERLLAAFRDEEYRVVPDAFSHDRQSPHHPLTPPPNHPTPPPQPLDEPLTNRELDVLELLAQRMQNKEIAEKLCISPETVKAHLKNIFQKLMVSTRRQAITRAKTQRILRRGELVMGRGGNIAVEIDL